MLTVAALGSKIQCHDLFNCSKSAGSRRRKHNLQPLISITRVQSSASGQAGTFEAPIVKEVTGTKNVVILGGSGRVGSSTAAALKRSLPNVNLTIASRSVESYNQAVARRPELRGSTHKPCNIDNPADLAAALKGADLVIHAAGPFQRREDCNVLEAAIAAGVPYMDICDDTAYSQRAKQLSAKAAAAGVPAITTAGIYPGISNVMAAHMISLNRKEYGSDWSYVGAADGAPQVERVLYSYFTAGSGGAGPTILETSFLLAGEDVVAYKDDRPVTVPPVSNRRGVDFGPGVGRRSLYLYNLPEVASGRQVFKVPNISARFGTDPFFWNWAMVLTARLLPKSFLEDRKSVAAFAKLADPLVRLVDTIVGEKVAMLIETQFDDGTAAAGLYVHKKLSDGVGECTAAFARCMLAGDTAPGVWFPEEQEALSDRRALLQLASEGTTRFLLNKPAWAIESNPIQIGMGFYWGLVVLLGGLEGILNQLNC